MYDIERELIVSEEVDQDHNSTREETEPVGSTVASEGSSGALARILRRLLLQAAGIGRLLEPAIDRCRRCRSKRR